MSRVMASTTTAMEPLTKVRKVILARITLRTLVNGSIAVVVDAITRLIGDPG